jgi:hypothetical protein
MATLTAAATNKVEAGILEAAWSLIYAYLDTRRDENFGHIGWKFIQFDVTGERLLAILTPLFGGPPK